MSNRHTYQLVNGRLEAPFPGTFEVRTIEPGPKLKLLREALPIDGKEIDLSGVGVNTILAFTCHPDRQHYRRVIEKTETSVTLQSHTTEKAALEGKRDYTGGKFGNCEIPLWKNSDFPNVQLWQEVYSIRRGGKGMVSCQ